MQSYIYIANESRVEFSIYISYCSLVCDINIPWEFIQLPLGYKSGTHTGDNIKNTFE